MKTRRKSRTIQRRHLRERSHQETEAGNPHASYTATQAKNEFGQLLERAIHGATVVITKHNAQRAVLISMDRFEDLQQGPQAELNNLSREFDSLVARMQTAAARHGMAAAFKASPKRLGKAAVKTARKRS